MPSNPFIPTTTLRQVTVVDGEELTADTFLGKASLDGRARTRAARADRRRSGDFSGRVFRSDQCTFLRGMWSLSGPQ